jgi:hypothetical protein
MSPHVNNFVTDLVSMAKAMEELPVVQRELGDAKAENSALLGMIAERDASLEQSRSYAASLEAKIHSAEVARDDAEFRFLEAEDRTASALAFIRTVFGNAGTLIQVLDPPKATTEPVNEPHPVPGEPTVPGEHPVAAQLDSHPVSDNIPSWATPEVDHTGDYIPKTEATPMGQREPDPTATTHHTVNEASTSHVVDATPVDTVGTTTEPPALGPYHGKRYYDHPSFMLLSEWLAGGGSEDDYTWRPSYGRI